MSLTLNEDPSMVGVEERVEAVKRSVIDLNSLTGSQELNPAEVPVPVLLFTKI